MKKRKKDIAGNEDLKRLFYRFYERSEGDELLTPFFERIKGDRFEDHIQTMADFWDNAVFFSGRYSGNPMEKHHMINMLSHFRPEHFDRWLHNFITTTDELFKGPNAEMTKKKAASVGKVMQDSLFTPPTPPGII